MVLSFQYIFHLQYIYTYAVLNIKGAMLMGKIILFIIFIFIMVVVNLREFERLQQGDTDYISTYSGFLLTLGLLNIIPLTFNIYGIKCMKIMFVIYALYISFYTWMYFKIRKWYREKNNSEGENE